MPSQRQLNRLLKLIADEYAKEGYDLLHMKAVFSKAPRYNDGRPKPRCTHVRLFYLWPGMSCASTQAVLS